MRLHTLFLVAVLLMLPVPAFALTPEVRDDAGFFKRETLTKADEIIQDIKKDKKKDLLIETFRHPPTDKEEEAKSTDHKEKDRFFSEWALERARKNEVNGIYVLICREPPYIKVAVGNETRKVFTDDERDHLGKILVDRFKAKEYDEGLLEAVRYVQKTLKDATGHDHDTIYHPGGGGYHGEAGAGLPPVGGDGGSGLGGWLCPGLAGLLCVGLVVVGGVFLLMRLFRGGAPAGPGGYGPGGYGPAGYGGGPAPSYGGGFGGMLGSFAASMLGSAAGAWVYDSFFGGHHGETAAPPPATPASTYDPGTESSTPSAPDTDYTAGGGGDFGGGGGDTGGGGDFGGGGGDFGGGEAGGGGGDFGGGDSGGDTGGGGEF